VMQPGRDVEAGIQRGQQGWYPSRRNRTAEIRDADNCPLPEARAEMLGRAGVSHAAAPAAAIAAGPLTIMCVLDYAAADSILDGGRPRQ